MKADIDQFKNQVGQIFEMMIALKDAVAAKNEEAQSSLQTRGPNQGNKANQEFPPYGLPLNYERRFMRIMLIKGTYHQLLMLLI